MTDVYFEHKETKTRFKILSVNAEKTAEHEAGTITLLGRHGVPFDLPYSKEWFQNNHYHPVQEAAQPAPQPPAPPPPPSAVPPPPAS